VEPSEFEILYRKNWRYVRSLLVGLGVPGRDLDDLCHEVFLIALQKVEQAELEVGTERFWLRQIGYYLVAGYKRRAFRRLEMPMNDPEEVRSSSPRHEPAVFETTDLLAVALSGLRERDSDLLALHIVGDLSFRTLGEICECDPKTARKRFLSAVQRARALVRDGTPGSSNGSPVSTPWAPRPSGVDPSVCRPFQLASRLDLRAFDESVAIGLAGRVVITHWYGAVTSSTLDLLLSECREMPSTLAGKFGYLALIEDSCRPPGFAERAKLLELLRFFRADVSAYATVSSVESKSLVFPIMSALGVLARIPFEMGFFLGLEQAAPWLFTRLGSDTGGWASAAPLVQAASALRSHWASHQAALSRAAQD